MARVHALVALHETDGLGPWAQHGERLLVRHLPQWGASVVLQGADRRLSAGRLVANRLSVASVDIFECLAVLVLALLHFDLLGSGAVEHLEGPGSST